MKICREVKEFCCVSSVYPNNCTKGLICLCIFYLFIFTNVTFSSVQFSLSVVSNSLQCHRPQHARPPCPSPTPRVYSNSCPWVSDAIQPSHPLSSPSPPALNLSQHQGLFKWVTSGGHSIGVSASTSVPPMNTLDWSPLGWTGWISLQSKRLSRVFSIAPQFKGISSLVLSLLYGAKWNNGSEF